MKRRAFFATVAGTMVIGGCLGEPDGDGESPPSEYSFELQSPTDTLSDTGSVGDGAFQSYTLSVPLATTFSCSLDVTAGPSVDFLTMNQNEFNRYRDEESFSAFSEWSKIGTREASIEGELSAGEYRFVVDRTAATLQS